MDIRVIELPVSGRSWPVGRGWLATPIRASPPWALMGSAVLMEIPIAMILACRLLPFRADRLANIIAGGVVTLVNRLLTFVPPLAGWGRPPAFAEYLFFATIETVCTSVIIWQAWTWSGVKPAVSSERVVGNPGRAMQDQGTPI